MIRGVWSRETIAWIFVGSLLPVLAALLIEQGMDAGQRILVSLAIIAVWQLVFLATRKQPLSPTGIVTAVAVTVLAPGEAALWQLALALSFGTVIGELVFGGWGRNVLSSAVVTLAFLYFGFPEVQHPPAGSMIALAGGLSAILLLATGIISWRVLAGAVLVLLAFAAPLGADITGLALGGSLVFGLVFLTCDPVASAATNPGRWVYGALTGGLAALFGWTGDGYGAPQTVVFATLVASLFAPLIDHAVIAIGIRQRRRLHG
jgi:Na+-transporting NADH:ubiquinone oxidoreductase subunit B